MTTQTTTPSTDGLDIPAALKRNPDNSLPGSTLTTEATKVAKDVAGKTGNRKARRAAAKAEKTAKAKTPAKPAKATHQPSKIERTEANPAKSIVPAKFKAEYAEHGGHNGDKVAEAMKKAIERVNDDGRPVLDMKLLEQLAKANGIDFTAYAHLNNGQKRMNVGNRLRGMLKAGKTVVIGSQKFANAEKALAKPAA